MFFDVKKSLSNWKKIMTKGKATRRAQKDLWRHLSPGVDCYKMFNPALDDEDLSEADIVYDEDLY